MTDQENLQVQNNLFDIYSGILFNNQTFADSGEKAEITYNFDCPEYKTLIEKYGIDKIAGEGTAFERGVRLMRWMAPKLTHKSDYDNHIPFNSLALLEYSLDKPEQGINCRNKSIILTECCLALGIYARRVYIMPYSPYDGDNHVVSEIYDPELGKWVMLDPTTSCYFIDKNDVPLSLLEIRDRFANLQYAAAVEAEADTSDKNALWEGNIWYNAYTAKNLFRFMVDGINGFGQGDKQTLYFSPAGCSVKQSRLANIRYRYERYASPEDEDTQKKFAEETDKANARPEPPAHSVSLLAAPPQQKKEGLPHEK